MIRSLSARGARLSRLLALGAVLVFGVGGLAAQALAQSTGSGTTTTTTGTTTQNSGNQDEPVRGVRRTFRLFGLADQAITGLRQGGRSSWKTTASGPSDDLPTLDADLSGRVIGTASSRNGYCCGYFELQLWAASARGDWARARDNIPSLENITGGNGYNARTQLSRWVTDPQQLVWTGRDGSIGSLFSGVTTTSGDGSCRDNSRRANDVIGAGQQLLAGSDCPPTWAGGVFRGETIVDDTTWLNDFRARGDQFSWNDYKFPASRRNPTRLYGAFQTYGATNDFGREVLLRAGNVVPGGSGKSNLEGFPMGIEWEWNVWTYAVPSLGDVMFYKANVINKSAQVYGVPIDYDSLYLGFMTRPFHTTSTQAPAVYAAPERGAVLSAQGNVNATNCYGNKTLGTDIRSCISSNTGFNGGAGAIVYLKSPIGDLRNKLFTRPSSPYYRPGHPLAGDTITYNIMTSCGFTCATQQITPGRVRAAYGGITGDVANALGGRGVTASELSQRQYHDLVRNPDWPNRWSPSTGTQGAYAKWVPPGNWDYNHDGRLDTLTVTTCWNSALTSNYGGTPVNGCVRPWSDTIPGGFPNNFHNNYFSGVGPVKLKGGDTTSFIVAFISVPDSISIERQVSDVIDLYQSFWLSPQPPVAPQVVSASVVGGNRQYDTEVRLFLDQVSNTQSDPFVLEAARKLKASTDRADVIVRTLNRTLVNDIRARALPQGTAITDTVANDTTLALAGQCRNAATYSAANCTIVTGAALGVVDSILVFKSCDGGTTYTATSGAACLPAPARDVASGNPSGYNWQSYARLGKDANTGRWPSQFRDGNVTGGVTYTYVLVAQAYPVTFQVVDVINGRAGVREYLVRTKTQNGLTANTANRNVATVYVPASTQAGGATSRAVITGVSMAGFYAPDTGSVVNTSIRLARPLRGGQPVAARVVYSDSATVRVFDSDTTRAGIDSTVVELHELVADSLSGTTIVRRAAGRTLRYVVPGTAPAVDIAPRQIGTSNVVTSTTVAGSGKVVKYAFGFSAFNRPQVTLLVAGQPQYVAESDASTVARDLTPGNTTARTDFVGALVTHGNPTFSSTPLATAWRLPGIPVLRADAWPTIKWVDATNRDSLAYGRYKVEFNDTEFGRLAPFRYDPRNPQAIRNAYSESLNGRGIADTTVRSAAAAAAISAATGTTVAATALAGLTLPFTVRNLRFGRPVQVAVLTSTHPATALLGSGGDTVRVNVPANRWIPGDQLYFLEQVPTYRYDTLSATPLVRRVRRLPNGDPDTTSVYKVTWGPVRIGCDLPAGVTPSNTCNPLTGFAATGYTLANKNEWLDLIWYAPLRGLVTADVTLLPEAAGAQIASVPASSLGNVRAVPNPYIMFSEYEQTNGTKRMMFVGLPPKGTLRIFTASGQFVQQINWVESDLEKNCRATTATTQCVATGDLTWNMRTRENLEIGPGFYMFVVSTEVGGSKQEKIGKFVIIH